MADHIRDALLQHITRLNATRDIEEWLCPQVLLPTVLLLYEDSNRRQLLYRLTAHANRIGRPYDALLRCAAVYVLNRWVRRSERSLSDATMVSLNNTEKKHWDAFEAFFLNPE